MSEARFVKKKYVKFKNRFLNLIYQKTDLLGIQQGLFYEDGGFVYNSYDFSVIYRGAEGEVLNYE